jgi:hypothetical protein
MAYKFNQVLALLKIAQIGLKMAIYTLKKGFVSARPALFNGGVYQLFG